MKKKALVVFVVVAVAGGLIAFVTSTGGEERAPAPEIAEDAIRIVDLPTSTSGEVADGESEPTGEDQLAGSGVAVNASDSLVKADVVEAIARLEPLIRGCAERVRAKEESLPEKISGRLVVDSVDGIGGVKISRFEGDPPGGQAMLDCVGLASELISFPTVNKVSGQLEVDYAFALAGE